MPNNLSVIILTHNSQESIENTLKSVSWADEIIIIDQESTDNTVRIAKKFTTKIHQDKSPRFDDRRNLGLKKSSNPWVLYIDADETISAALEEEILNIIKSSEPKNFEFIRQNYFLGVKMYPDKVQRLFHKSTLKNWAGEVHETPIFKGSLITLKNPLIHHTHTDIFSMLEKTNQWSEIEAKLRLDANHPPVKVWRVFRIALTEFYNQFFGKKVYKYGEKGWIEGLFQVIDKMIIYIKLWEMQQK